MTIRIMQRKITMLRHSNENEVPTESMVTRVLVIEDDEQTAAELVLELGRRGYDTHHSDNGLQGLSTAQSENWDLLIVDRMLPELDGLSLLRKLRLSGNETPVIVLSALNAIDDKVLGLRAGGDDYISKPFAFEELTARMEALLRRPPRTSATIRRVDALELDLVNRSARRGCRRLNLLTREFQILDYLMSREGQVVTRAMLLEDIWKYRFIPKTNLVDVHMGRLRRKVDAEDEPPFISSIRNVGFIFRAPE